jgi:hypothetical protein
MTMVRVEYTLQGDWKNEKHVVRGWDFHQEMTSDREPGYFVMDESVRGDNGEITIVRRILGGVDTFATLSVRPCDGSINEHLTKCRQWTMTDAEIEELLH